MQLAGPGYLINQGADCRFVEAWTMWRLPFMNLKPEQSQYRHELRSAVARLITNGTLEATYTSEDNKWAADLENVLFYNLGTAVFREVARDSLRFLRKNSATPSCPSALTFAPRHHVRYESGGTQAWFHPAGAIAAEAQVSCKEFSELKDVPGLWRSFKAGMSCAPMANDLHRSPFTLRLVISIPQSRRRVNLAEVIKPLADAFMSALHHYQGRQLDAVVDRLSVRLKCWPDAARELLLDRKSAALGPRAVPHLRGQGIQWSPADDLLVGGEFLSEVSGNEFITVRGELFLA